MVLVKTDVLCADNVVESPKRMSVLVIRTIMNNVNFIVQII